MSGKNRVAGMENRDRISAGIKHTSRRRVAQSLLATVQNTMLGVFMELWSESCHDRVKEEPRALLLSISLWRVLIEVSSFCGNAADDRYRMTGEL